MSIRTDRLGPWAVAIMIAFTGCQTPATISHDLTATDLAAVRAIWDDMQTLGTDWDALQQFLTDDFVHLDPRTPQLVGVEAWREWVESMELGDDQSQYTVEEVAGSGDLAYIRWSFSGSWTESGELVESQGKGISIYTRMPDGSWRLSRNAWNATS